MINNKKVSLGPFRKYTSCFRLFPDFIIIGGQRCGSSTLYHSMIKHPCVAPALHKEIHYFDMNYNLGQTWYRAQFPLRLYTLPERMMFGGHVITGEATPYYIIHPHAPHRARSTVPDAKIIAVLRNPVDRAYSHYLRVRRKGWESLSFEDAIDNETERLSGELNRMVMDENYFSYNYHKYSYLTRGFYVDGLLAWNRYYPKEQILVIKSEDLFEDPSQTLGKVFRHCGIPEKTIRGKVWKRKGKGEGDVMTPQTRERLAAFFRPHNERLYEYLGKDLSWE